MGSIGTAPEAIPTVDISSFIANASDQTLREVVEAVRHACTTYGFFYLVGHGVSLEDQNKALQCAKLFFTLPVEERMEVAIKNSMGKSHRGYEPPGIQTHQEGLLPDTKEVSPPPPPPPFPGRGKFFYRSRLLITTKAFIIGAEVPADDPEAGTFSTGPNLWPKALPREDFQIPSMEYQSKMVELVKVLLKILALGLPKEWGCLPDVFDELAVNPSIPMRLLHYAPQTVRDERQFGGTFYRAR